MDTFDLARGRAEDLVSTGTQGLAVALDRAGREVRDHAPEIDVRSLEVPGVDDLVHQAASHKVRTTLIFSLVVLIVLVVVRKATAGHDEPNPSVSS